MIKKTINYKNIMKYDLISFIFNEYGNAKFSYIAIILDPSVGIEGYDEKPYDSGCIVEVFMWNQPMTKDIGQNKTELYENINRMKEKADRKGYEFYIFSVSPENRPYPTIKLVTDEVCNVTNAYNGLKDEVYYGGTNMTVESIDFWKNSH